MKYKEQFKHCDVSYDFNTINIYPLLLTSTKIFRTLLLLQEKEFLIYKKEGIKGLIQILKKRQLDSKRKNIEKIENEINVENLYVVSYDYFCSKMDLIDEMKPIFYILSNSDEEDYILTTEFSNNPKIYHIRRDIEYVRNFVVI